MKDFYKRTLVLLLFFCIIIFVLFRPILMDGMRYGCVPIEQSLVFDKTKALKLLSNLPSSSIHKFNNYLDFNKDYINLHLPKAEIFNKIINNSQLTPYDSTRLLGLSIPGHPLADVFNPLNILFKKCDFENFVIYKSIFYLLIGFLSMSFFIHKIEICNNKYIQLCGSLLFTLMPNNFHYLHWDNYIGVSMMIPLIFTGFYYLSIREYVKAFIFIIAFLYLSLIVNMAELFIYNSLFALLFFLIVLILQKRKMVLLKKSIITLLFSLIIITLFGIPQIFYSIEYLEQLKRDGNFSTSSLNYKYPYFPRDNGQYLGIIGIPCFWKTQHSIILNISILFFIFLSFINYRKSSFIIKSIVISFTLCTLFLFFGFIDLPLYMVDFYNILANQIRAINVFTFLSSILFINGLSIILRIFDSSFKCKSSLIMNGILILNLFVLFLFILFLLNPFDYFYSYQKFGYLIFEYSLYIFASSFLIPFLLYLFYKSIISFRLFSITIPIAITVPYILFAKSIIPFYDSSDLIKISTLNEFKFSTRCVIINKETENIKARDWQGYCGTFLWSMGENPLTGYDTGLTKTSAKILHDFWDKRDYNELKSSKQFSWINWHEYWVPPSPNSLLSYENNGTRVNSKILLKMKLLGVSRIYSNYLLENLTHTDTKTDYYLYDLNLSSPFCIVRDNKVSQISNFLTNCHSHDLNSSSIINLSKNEVTITESGLPAFDIASESGFLILPYDFSDDFYIKSSCNKYIKRDDSSGLYIIDLSKHRKFTVYYNHHKFKTFSRFSSFPLFSLALMLLYQIFYKYKSIFS